MEASSGLGQRYPGDVGYRFPHVVCPARMGQTTSENKTPSRYHSSTNLSLRYEDCLIDTMYQYSTHPVHYLSELEVFIGNIIGKVGAQSKRQREYSTSMKEKFERDVTFTINCILKDPVTGKESEESLERSIACLAVAMEENIPRKKVGVLRSFAYIAAAVCLKEVEKFQGPLWG